MAKSTSNGYRAHGRWQRVQIISEPRRGSKNFSRGGFSKQFWKLIELFLGWPNWFSEISQTIIKTLIWPNFLRRRQIYEKFIFFPAFSSLYFAPKISHRVSYWIVVGCVEENVLIILRVVKLARFIFCILLFKKKNLRMGKKAGSKTKCTFFIRNTTKVDRKEKQDCSYQGEALNVPTAF